MFRSSRYWCGLAILWCIVRLVYLAHAIMADDDFDDVLEAFCEAMEPTP